MAEADYRLMTEATGQRIAIALENLAGFGAYLTTSDVVNDLTNTATDKPLSAAQGKALNDNITTINSNLGQQLFFGAGNGKYYYSEKTNIDDAVNDTINPTTDANGYFTINNKGSVSGYGNRQFIIGWLNAEKNFGWCLILSFEGMGFGKRARSSAFSITKIN